MPRLDKTGPNGQGPQTGRGMGNCGFFSRCFSRRGFGFFGCNRLSPEEREKILEEELSLVRQEKNQKNNIN